MVYFPVSCRKCKGYNNPMPTDLPSRERSKKPILGKGKSLTQKCFGMRYVSSLKGIQNISRIYLPPKKNKLAKHNPNSQRFTPYTPKAPFPNLLEWLEPTRFRFGRLASSQASSVVEGCGQKLRHLLLLQGLEAVVFFNISPSSWESEMNFSSRLCLEQTSKKTSCHVVERWACQKYTRGPVFQ